MLTNVDYQISRNPSRFFKHSPESLSHRFERFEEVAENGTQKVLWTMCNNLVRDWYWYGCREFGLKAEKIEANFFPRNNLTLKQFMIIMGDCGQYIQGKFPDRIITKHSIRISMPVLRAFPGEIYFLTIPHEVCHALAEQIYNKEIRCVLHGTEWSDIMDYFGIPVESTVHTEQMRKIIEKSSIENVSESLSVTYPYEELSEPE